MSELKPIWPAMFASLVIAYAIFLLVKHWGWWQDDEIDKWATFVTGGMITGVLVLGALGAGYGLGSAIGDHCDQIWHQCWHGRMVSMRSTDGIKGSVSGGIFMVHGFVGSAQVYRYYTQKEDGSFQPHQWTADNDTAIFEENRKDGEVFQFDEKFKNPRMEWIGYTGDRLRMDFHVPVGSIKRDFSAN